MNFTNEIQKIYSNQSLAYQRYPENFRFFHKEMLLLFLSFLSGNFVVAQNWETLPVSFEVNGTTLKNPLAGGLNNPQLSEVDLNFDGIQDLYVFDREGDVSLAFLTENIDGENQYVYSLLYSNVFPRLRNWVLLRDYDGDGIQDIFAYPITPGIDGVIVFKGYNNGGDIAFERVNFYNGNFNIIYYPQPSGNFSNLYVSRVDYPAIDDIDGDGDLDIVSFANLGGVIYFYKNISVESGFGRDSLLYVREDNCWGGVYEDGATMCPSLASSPGECGESPPFTTKNLHAGSTLLTLGLDDDDDKELILGDQAFNNLVALTNGGTAQNAWFNEMDCAFPSYDVACDIFNFPAAFFLDVNQDGKKDLLAAPNNKATVADKECLWYWENTGSNSVPVFEFQQTDFLTGEMLDHGTGSNPCLVDYNADGLLDLLVGNFTEYLPGQNNPRLYLYENTGTTTQPAFTLIDDDYLNFSLFGSIYESNLAPSFGDLDGDGDEDLLVGSGSGNLYYAENIAGAGNVFEFNNIVYPYKGIDGSSMSTVQIIDLDRDGLLDIVLGESNGNINFLPNQGTTTNPVFHADIDEAPNNPFLGNVNTDLTSITGGSSPFFMDLDGTMVLFCGTKERGLVRYDNIDNNLDGVFTWTTDLNLGGIYDGRHTHTAVADLNADNRLDFVIGNDRGGLRIFSSDINLSGEIIAVGEVPEFAFIKLFPNPVKDQLSIECKTGNCKNISLEIFDSFGKCVKKITKLENKFIDLTNLHSGIYFCSIHHLNNNYVRKIIVIN